MLQYIPFVVALAGMSMGQPVEAGCHGQLQRRDIPYGGILTFGNLAVVPQTTAPCAQSTAPKPQRNGKLLGLVDLALGVHL
ncbi:hypothetical protein EC988_004385 [Linderina pennispora]|nr:hypothetical protein EC988_004385 [Linderina pennispora]